MARRLILASESPRRAELLREAGFAFEVRPAGVAEWPYRGGPPAAYAESLARAKVEAGAAAAASDEVVLGADTVVVVDGDVLGKPRGAAEAVAMLRLLSGRGHDVITAVAVGRGGAVRSLHDRTRVTFRSLDADEIGAYVAWGEPMDKAGAYAIQGGASAFVAGLEGRRDTVIGLPLPLVRRLLGMG